MINACQKNRIHAILVELTMHDPVQPHEHRARRITNLNFVIIALPNISYVFGSIPSLFFVILRALLLSGSSHDARRVFTKIRGNPKKS